MNNSPSKQPDLTCLHSKKTIDYCIECGTIIYENVRYIFI